MNKDNIQKVKVDIYIPMSCCACDWQGFMDKFFQVLWEFLLIGLPVIAAAIVIFVLWWNKLPAEKKEKYKSDPSKKSHRRSKKTGQGGGVVSFITTIIWLIIVWANGYWNTPFSEIAFTTWVNLMIWSLLWFLIVCGTPMLLGGIWWLRKELRK
ncbi:MAG: hypothetical protein ACFFCS_29920 [Candidatus Hodarchaeota archaeon]